MATFQLSIVTPETTIFEEMVESIVVPGAKGYLGVLANHAPLITPLQPGKITIHLPGRSTEIILAVTGGFLEVAQNQATILADSAEHADKIDRERAAASLERARQRLGDHPHDLDTDRATEAYRRAQNRLRILDDILVGHN